MSLSDELKTIANEYNSTRPKYTGILEDILKQCRERANLGHYHYVYDIDQNTDEDTKEYIAHHLQKEGFRLQFYGNYFTLVKIVIQWKSEELHA